MPSPFPGMDPWLESPSHFPDFHSGFLSTIRAALNDSLPRPFFAALSTRVFLEQSKRSVEPDVNVYAPRDWSDTWQPESSGSGGTTVLTDELVELDDALDPLPDEEISESFVEIYSTDGEQKLITSIELLSLANKTSAHNGRKLYRAKQREMKANGVNVIEIDLLRKGTGTTLASRCVFPKRVGGFHYHVSVWRADKPQSTFGVPIRLNHALPTIPIPLTPAYADVPLNLQSAFARTYDEAAFSRRVRYDRPCDPALHWRVSEWADVVLKSTAKLTETFIDSLSAQPGST